ncbi:MAG: TraB/GumN family protein [Bacteroidota bacterium]|nr:TraB/GumN family protein [Bacteroidota bacterium]
MMSKNLKHLFFPILMLLAPSAFSQDSHKSLLWEISGNGLSEPSYLYGTMHTADKRVFNFKRGVIEAFNNAQAFAMELDFEKSIKFNLIEKLIMDSGYTIQSLLSEEEYAKVSAFFRDSLKQNVMMYNKMQPMFLASMVSQRNLKKDMGEPLDLYFNSLAKEQNKQIYGLETMEEQINAFSSISYKEQAEALLDAVENSEQGKNEMEQMLEDYISGDLDKLLNMTKDKEMSEDFIEIFLTKRNRIMAERAEVIMKEKSVFIAVGAAHLAGEQGLISLFQNKGYRVWPR